MPSTQQAVLLTPGSADPVSASVPSSDASTSTAIYASLFHEKADIQLVELPLSRHLAEESKIHLLHASDSQDGQNKLAGEVLFDPSAKEQLPAITGKAYLLYAQQGKDFSPVPDFQALHEVCYDAKLSSMSKGSDASQHGAEMANEFEDRLAQLAQKATEGEEEEDDNDDGAWTDEDVEKPREKKEESDSDDEDQEAGDDDEDDGEDSNASYEDESELESDDDDDENDPRKKALLDAIKTMISKDGKLDLERLGLVERNGKLVPKE